jgi:hypothetical protein
VKPTRYLRLTKASLEARLHGQRLVHFLHIGKNAGTALKAALTDVPTGNLRVVMHPHGVRMVDLPHGDSFFFIVRDPIARFQSGFLARQRHDQPRFYSEWTEAEERAFNRFSTPAELGFALTGSVADRAAAEEALRSIEHVRSSYWDWFGSPRAFHRREKRILWIGFQESLAAQLPLLGERLGIGELVLPSGVAANESVKDAEELPDGARAALEVWYHREYEFVALCREAAERLALS